MLDSLMESNVPKEFASLAKEQAAAEAEYLGRENVVGVALGHRLKNDEDTGEQAITVLVESKLPPEMLRPEDLIKRGTKTSKGTPVDVQEVGFIQAGVGAVEAPSAGLMEPAYENGATHQMAAPLTLAARARPVMGGYSVGHYKITAGTIATCCYDRVPFPSIPERYYILSNNHVLANSNNALVGDPVLQPGPFDGGALPGDAVARLSRWVPIRFTTPHEQPCNFVDAAIAEGPFHDLSREVYWSGYVQRVYAAPKVGDIVQKTGRTTNFTTGEITHVNATVLVNYGAGRVAKFCRQIITKRMGAGGDSGSLVLNREEGAVGLLFAGSNVVTIINHINLVQALLSVRITEL